MWKLIRIAALYWPVALSAQNMTTQAELSAFVGRPISLEEAECHSSGEIDPKTGQQLVSICLDAVYRAMYHVEQSLEGNLAPGAIVTFMVADHYGFPAFAKSAHALLYLAHNGENYYHLKYQWDEVFLTADSDYAGCGCDDFLEGVPEAEVKEKSIECKNLLFMPPVTIDLHHMSAYGRQEYEGSADFNVQGHTATCIRGRSASDIYQNKRQDLLDAIRN